MPMKTPGGQETYKFDQTVPDDVKRTVHKSELLVNGFQATLKSVTDELKEEIDKTNGELAKLGETVEYNKKSTEHYIMVYGERLNRLEMLTFAFLESPLMRFLNFFGCWYIYSKAYKGMVFLNCPKNEKYGKAPLLTRLSRWFRVKILNQPDPRRTYYNSREPEEDNETTEEECTNDTERVQPAEEQGDPRAVLERDRDGDS